MSPACPRCSGASRPWVVPYDRAAGTQRAVRRCDGCGIGFTWPQLQDTPAAPTDGPTGGILSRAADALLAAELRPVFEVMPPGARVLDIGAGSGVRTRLIARAGRDVTAVEPDPVEAGAARRRLAGMATVRQCGIEEFPDGDTAYDGAVLSHVLEHLADPDASLAAIRTRLRPGGHIVIFVPNAAGLEARVLKGRWHAWEPSRHRWHFTKATLARALADAGYGGIDVRARGGWRYPATLAFSIAPRLDPQTRRGPHHLVGRAFVLAVAPLAALERVTGYGPQLVAVARVPMS